MRANSSALVPLCFLAAACGSSTDPTQATADPAADGGSAEAAASCEHSLTSFEGDCLALEPPDPGEGFQLHYGPDDYDNPDELQRFVLPAGGEINDCQYRRTPNETEIFFNRYQTRMRPGTHHLIVFGTDQELELGKLAECREGTGLVSGSAQWLFAAQSGLGKDGGRLDYPPAGEALPPENQGLAFRLAAQKYISYNMHYVNTSDEALLRESWSNIFYADDEDVAQIAEPIVFIGGLGMNVPPATTEVVTASCKVPAEADSVRIIDLWPHMHSHGQRFTAYRVSAAGDRERIYESYDWEEPLSVFFDSVHENPEPSSELGTDGAISGLLELGPGESIDYECEIKNDLDQSLVFANEAYTAEMCNLFGTFTSETTDRWTCFNQ